LIAHPVWWVGEHALGGLAVHQALEGGWLGAVADDQPVISQQPQVALAADSRPFGILAGWLGRVLGRRPEDKVHLRLAESGQGDVESHLGQIQELGSQQLGVPP